MKQLRHVINHHRKVSAVITPPPTLLRLPGSRNGWSMTAPILRASASPLNRRQPIVSERLSHNRDCNNIYQPLNYKLLHRHNLTFNAMMISPACRRISHTGACVPHNLANLHNDVIAPPTSHTLPVARQLIFISHISRLCSLPEVAAAAA